MRIFLCAFLLMNINAVAQDNILQFQFKSFTRGYSESVTIRNDSTFITIVKRTDSGSQKEVKTLTANEDWKNLLTSIKTFELAELSSLPAPSHYNSGDGAPASSILIKTNELEYHSNVFDGYNPNAKLKPLMDIIVSIKEKLVK